MWQYQINIWPSQPGKYHMHYTQMNRFKSKTCIIDKIVTITIQLKIKNKYIFSCPTAIAISCQRKWHKGEIIQQQSL